MTPKQLEAVGKLLYGQYWYTPMGEGLDVNERTIRRWFTGEIKIPKGVSVDLIDIANGRADVVKADMDVRAKKAIAILERLIGAEP